MRRIRADFEYDTEAAMVSTPISEAFGERGGIYTGFRPY